MKKRFARLDKDSDGSVTLEEFKAGFQSQGKAKGKGKGKPKKDQ